MNENETCYHCNAGKFVWKSIGMHDIYDMVDEFECDNCGCTEYVSL